MDLDCQVCVIVVCAVSVVAGRDINPKNNIYDIALAHKKHHTHTHTQPRARTHTGDRAHIR